MKIETFKSLMNLYFWFVIAYLLVVAFALFFSPSFYLNELDKPIPPEQFSPDKLKEKQLLKEQINTFYFDILPLLIFGAHFLVGIGFIFTAIVTFLTRTLFLRWFVFFLGFPILIKWSIKKEEVTDREWVVLAGLVFLVGGLYLFFIGILGLAINLVAFSLSQ